MPVVDMREAAPLVIGATGLDAVVQNIRMILTTFAYSVPLDRRFASHGGAIDAPAPVMAALRIAELTDAIEEKEPRAEVGHRRKNFMSNRTKPLTVPRWRRRWQIRIPCIMRFRN